MVLAVDSSMLYMKYISCIFFKCLKAGRTEQYWLVL